MTTLSPLLQNRIGGAKTPIQSQTQTGAQKPNNRHEKIYQDLQKRANEVKPNEAKAVMVKEGMLGNPITAVKDSIKDAGNFFTAVKTGKMGDNSLGRINDLGLVLGSGIIATYLAAHSKTKTESIMRFVGGATFLSVMSLWPKIFINIPARLVHGFRIDRKYISAQGDKKDYWLDNQFIVKDARDEKELRAEAKRAGIDYDSKNGREKIEEKERKTALQNRTLWMATAGGATPLLTALFGDFIEPKIQDAVIKNDFNKVKNITNSGISDHIKNVSPMDVDNSAIDALIKNYEGKALDDDFFKQLSDILVPSDFLGAFKDADDKKVFKGYNPTRMAETLQDLRKSGKFSEFDKDELETLLRKSLSIVASDPVAQFVVDDDEVEQVAKQTSALLSDADVKKIMGAIGDDLSFKKVLSVLEDPQYALASESKKHIQAVAKTNDEKFFEFIKSFNQGPLATMRARARAYVDMVNPVVGSKAESVYTSSFNKSTAKLFEVLGYNRKQLLEIRKKDDDAVIDILSKTISDKVKDLSDDEYKKFLQSLMPKQNLEGVEEVVAKLKDADNLKSIIADLEIEGFDKADVETLMKAVMGGGETEPNLLNIIRSFIEVKEIDTNAIKSKALICANFERRLAKGDLKDALSADDLILARKILYDGTISVAKCNGYNPNSNEYNAVLEKIFKGNVFANEKEIMPNIEAIVDNLKTIFKNSSQAAPTMDYLACGSFMDIAKKCAKAFGNNKAWKSIFVPMTGALIAVTLLVQPFFGNIKKEFPQDENGGAK